MSTLYTVFIPSMPKILTKSIPSLFPCFISSFCATNGAPVRLFPIWPNSGANTKTQRTDLGRLRPAGPKPRASYCRPLPQQQKRGARVSGEGRVSTNFESRASDSRQSFPVRWAGCQVGSSKQTNISAPLTQWNAIFTLFGPKVAAACGQMLQLVFLAFGPNILPAFGK